MITRIEYYIGFVILVLGFIALAMFIDNYMPYVSSKDIQDHYRITRESITKFEADLITRESYGVENRQRICQLQLNQMMIAIKVGVREPIFLDSDCTELLQEKK